MGCIHCLKFFEEESPVRSWFRVIHSDALIVVVQEQCMFSRNHPWNHDLPFSWAGDWQSGLRCS